MSTVFVTGSTGYLGRGLTRALLARGYSVRALARASSVSKVPEGCTVVIGDALDAATFRDAVAPADTIVHLAGVSHPSPWKAAEFARVDLPSVRATIDAAAYAGVGHIVYVSVAQPAPIMRAYLAVRAECESLLRASGIPVTFVRPWYVLGPGHWWPLVLVPLYRIFESIPSRRETAERLGLVRHEQMIAALCEAVAEPPPGARIVDVPAIRRAVLRPSPNG